MASKDKAKTKQAQREPETGIVFPLEPTAKPGKQPGRGSTFGNQAAIAAAFAAVNDDAEAKKVLGERNWRDNYTNYFVDMVKRSISGGHSETLKMAHAAMDYCWDNFDFVRPGQPTVSLRKAMETYTENVYRTGEVSLERGSSASELRVPYKGKILSSAELGEALKYWEKYGTIEASAGQAIQTVVDNQRAWLEQIRYRPGSSNGVTFVLLGCGAAMGHFRELMDLGADIVGIDLDRPKVWKTLFGVVHKKAAQKTGGRFRFPIRAGEEVDEKNGTGVGSNMITETPEIRNWLLSLLGPTLSADPTHQVIVCNYAYLDGASHVKVSLAMDAISTAIAKAFPSQTMLAYLCTPTDCHIIPIEALDAAKENLSSWGLSTVLKPFLKPNVVPIVEAQDGHKFAIVNGLMTRQGPNYALAKRIQHWRAVIAREDFKCKVSSNVAPMTFTESVTHNTLFRWAYGGAHRFRPAEIFDPNTCRGVTLALLLYDFLSPDSVANPNHELRNPYELMMHTSFHGGVWRTGFAIDSVGDASAYLYLATPWYWPGELMRAFGVRSKL